MAPPKPRDAGGALPIPQWLDETTAELALLAPIREGLRDFLALNLSQEARDEVGDLMSMYDKAISQLTDTQRTLQSLVDEGYPYLRTREVTAQILADLQANADTIAAALAQFTGGPAPATALNPSAGSIEKK
jgi:hypothetical protein